MGAARFARFARFARRHFFFIFIKGENKKYGGAKKYIHHFQADASLKQHYVPFFFWRSYLQSIVVLVLLATYDELVGLVVAIRHFQGPFSKFQLLVFLSPLFLVPLYQCNWRVRCYIHKILSNLSCRSWHYFFGRGRYLSIISWYWV